MILNEENSIIKTMQQQELEMMNRKSDMNMVRAFKDGSSSEDDEGKYNKLTEP